MIVEIPRPCQASATRKATSARSASIRTYAAWAMIVWELPLAAIRPKRSR